jgi:hypothetical protein
MRRPAAPATGFLAANALAVRPATSMTGRYLCLGAVDWHHRVCGGGAAMSASHHLAVGVLVLVGTACCARAADPPAGSQPPTTVAPPKGQSLDELVLFFPTKFPDGNWKPDGVKFEDAWFNAPGGPKLHGWYCPCDNPRAVLLFAHGNAGNLSHRAAWMTFFQTRLRVTALIFDYRGYGRSEGTPTVEGSLQDARAARAFLAGRAKVKETDIVLMGESLGGAVAVDLAGKDGARGLILISTFSSLRDMAAHHYPNLAWLVPAGKFDSTARIAKYKGLLLQSHGDTDWTIPFALGRKLYDAAPGKKQFVRVAGADHNDGVSADYLQQLDRFIADLPAR